MRFHRLLCALLLGLGSCTLAAEGLSPTAADFSGLIYRRGSDKRELLFTLQARRQDALWVDHYTDAKGADAVIERVFFKDHQVTRYEFDNVQQQGLGVMVVQGPQSVLSWTVAGKTVSKTVDTPGNLTFGPLYCGLLQARFADLVAGKKVLGSVPVLTQDHLMTAELAFQRKQGLEKKDGRICVSMKPANWFIALFFPPIDLYFNQETKALEDVHGISLLKEKRGGDWKLTDVDLYYRYQP